jgi:bacterioferritin-associated ferredoxin
MIVCHCHGVTDRVIRRSIREGASTCAQVSRACAAGGGCGGCRPAILEIIESEQSRPGPAAAVGSGAFAHSV